jgi:methylated-DNA-protein-cysteine methyltransferase-like protein
MVTEFSELVIRIIKQIPYGKVATYGQIASYAGNPKGARQVSWLLHSSSQKENLPWHRVVNSKGRISLPKNHGYKIQKGLLEEEGIVFTKNDSIDFKRYLWDISSL